MPKQKEKNYKHKKKGRETMKISRIFLLLTIVIGLLSSTAAYAKSVSYTDITEAKWDDIRPYSEGMSAVMQKVIKKMHMEMMLKEKHGVS